MATDEKHYIKPIYVKGTQAEVKTRLLKVLAAEKRTNVLIVQADYIRVEFTSALFRFVDDVEFCVLENQAGDAVIHVRSASRVGYSDLDANRKRIEKIRSKLEIIP